ncbi:type I-E CRISPR-associated protein Cse2/CasB [Actinomadura parmotrematis]|uniref:Type I-E CRISPR-associated protein Cse2/CasB n=1 Tax=Actinomadura parmotrematis TaxID=2864039 RepID=A0ABS7FW87_9ACTN|nr:type I-E CRISPR-associated protein Cse2/CasB [Actinomadura parmotrematis]MBW8484435.1 type I-E CRISPR-associated protein Cse2/CasB [Actinomadura parmotrematis]
MTSESSTEAASPARQPSEAADFIALVHRLCEDPGKRAALRSGLGQPIDKCQRMHKLIAAYVPAGRDTDRERAYYAIASMIASLPPQARGAQDAAQAKSRNFGVCLAEGVARGVLRESAAEARLNLLTRQSTKGLHRHLPAAVRALAVRPDSVDWTQLLLDIRTWDTSRERTARRWLQEFYRTRFKTDQAAAKAGDELDPPQEP